MGTFTGSVNQGQNVNDVDSYVRNAGAKPVAKDWIDKTTAAGYNPVAFEIDGTPYAYASSIQNIDGAMATTAASAAHPGSLAPPPSPSAAPAAAPPATPDTSAPAGAAPAAAAPTAAAAPAAAVPSGPQQPSYSENPSPVAAGASAATPAPMDTGVAGLTRNIQGSPGARSLMQRSGLLY